MHLGLSNPISQLIKEDPGILVLVSLGFTVEPETQTIGVQADILGDWELQCLRLGDTSQSSPELAGFPVNPPWVGVCVYLLPSDACYGYSLEPQLPTRGPWIRPLEVREVQKVGNCWSRESNSEVLTQTQAVKGHERGGLWDVLMLCCGTHTRALAS